MWWWDFHSYRSAPLPHNYWRVSRPFRGPAISFRPTTTFCCGWSLLMLLIVVCHCCCSCYFCPCFLLLLLSLLFVCCCCYCVPLVVVFVVVVIVSRCCCCRCVPSRFGLLLFDDDVDCLRWLLRCWMHLYLRDGHVLSFWPSVGVNAPKNWRTGRLGHCANFWRSIFLELRQKFAPMRLAHPIRMALNRRRHYLSTRFVRIQCTYVNLSRVGVLRVWTRLF